MYDVWFSGRGRVLTGGIRNTGCLPRVAVLPSGLICMMCVTTLYGATERRRGHGVKFRCSASLLDHLLKAAAY